MPKFTGRHGIHTFWTDQRKTASHDGWWSFWWWSLLLFQRESSSAESLRVRSKTAGWLHEHVWNVGRRNSRTVGFSSNCVALPQASPHRPRRGQLGEASRCRECRPLLSGLDLFTGMCVCVFVLLVLVFLCLCYYYKLDGEGFSLGLGLCHCFAWI